MHQLLEILKLHPFLLYSLTAVLGLCIGSFLNVVIYRMPLMMQREWQSDIEAYLQEEQMLAEDKTAEPDQLKKADINNEVVSKALNLSFPRSHCPKCGHTLSWYENIPVLSWLLQKAKCRHCSAPIWLRYPAVELITSLLSVLIIWSFGPTATGIAALVLAWALIALAGIDFDTQLLPDRITLPLAALGLLVNTQNLFVNPTLAIYGYVIGFLSLWVVYYAYKLLTGKEGMGYGDFKLLAALGAWLGPMQLPLIILASSFLGAIVGMVLMRIKGQSVPFAFGPYIAIAGIISLIWGPQIMQWYIGLSHVSQT